MASVCPYGVGISPPPIHSPFLFSLPSPTPMCLPSLYLSHSFYCISPASLFLFEFLHCFIAVAPWPRLPAAVSKWCDCACVCTRTSVESLTRARRECGSTALLNPGNSLRTTRHGWYPETRTGAKVCLRLPSNTHTSALIYIRFASQPHSCSFIVLDSFAVCLDTPSRLIDSICLSTRHNHCTLPNSSKHRISNLKYESALLWTSLLRALRCLFRLFLSANLQSDNALAVQLHSYGCCHCICFSIFSNTPALSGDRTQLFSTIWY